MRDFDAVAQSEHFSEDVVGKRSKYKEKHQNSKIELKGLNQKQKTYINLLRSSDQTIAIGSAGTGKTYIATVFAAQLLQSNQISKIVLTRPNVPSGRSLGFFPGTLEEKMANWVVPFMETLGNVLGHAVLECQVKKKNVEVVPLETMRGRSFENALIILDEAQNADLNELQMFLTRIGNGSKVVICGDISQSDLKNSGLQTCIDIAQKHEIPLGFIEFTVDDIVRSDICAQWVKAFEAHKRH